MDRHIQTQSKLFQVSQKTGLQGVTGRTRGRVVEEGAERAVKNSSTMHQNAGIATYAEITKEKKYKNFWKRKRVRLDSEIWRGLELEVKDDEMEWLQKCYVEEVQNPGAIHLLQDRLVEERITNFSITPMGGDLVLIKPTEGEDLEQFIKEYEELLESWFHDIRHWSPREVVREREAWICCQGVPLHGCSIKLFEMLAGSLEKLDSVDESTMNNKRFDVARFLIRTSSWEVANRLVKIRINDMFFNIRLLEEPFQEFTCGKKQWQ